MRLLGIALALALVGCGDDDRPAIDAGSDGGRADVTVPPSDAGWDAGGDELDAGTDAGEEPDGDAGTDGGTDGGSDAGTDAGMDAGLGDAGVDAGLDAGLDDAGMDASADAGTDGAIDGGPAPLAFGTNFDFEDWTTTDPPPAFAKTPDTSFTIVAETTGVAVGASSASVTWTTTDDRDLVHVPTHTVTDAVRHTFHAWVYDDDPSGRTRLAITPGAAATVYDTTYSTDAMQWQELTLAVTPAVGDDVTVSMRFYDVGTPFTMATLYLDAWALTVPTPWTLDGTVDVTAFDISTGAGLVAAVNDDGRIYVSHPAAAGYDRFLYVWLGGADGTAAVPAPWAKSGSIAGPITGGALLVLAQEEASTYCEWRVWNPTAATWFPFTAGASCYDGASIEGQIDPTAFGLMPEALPAQIAFASTAYGTNDGDALISAMQVPASADADGDVDPNEVSAWHRALLLAGQLP